MRGLDYIAVVESEWLNQIGNIAEFITIILSLVGLLISFQLTLFFAKGDTLAQRLKSEYFTDFLGFAVLFFMGVGLFFNWPLLVKIDVIIRPFVVLLNLIAMRRLYEHYKRL